MWVWKGTWAAATSSKERICKGLWILSLSFWVEGGLHITYVSDDVQRGLGREFCKPIYPGVLPERPDR